MIKNPECYKNEISLTTDFQKVFDLLYNSYGQFIDFNVMTRNTGLDKPEILKHLAFIIKHKDCITIDDARGICLHDIPENLLSSIITSGLQTLVAGKHIYCFPALDSTNQRAKKMASQGVSDGTLILAEQQTAGRGRMDRKWISPPGVNILCSMIFHPPLQASSVFKLTMLTSVAIVEAIKKTCALKAQIKWPNDVYINGKKVCGILSEFSTTGNSIDHVIVGIGINVNFDTYSHPEIKEIATSLKEEKGSRVSRLQLIKNIILETDLRYRKLTSSNTEWLTKEWNQNCLVINQQVKIITDKSETCGVAKGINEEGQLLLMDKTGQLHEIVFGDVSLRL